jgi:hypothetical protein
MRRDVVVVLVVLVLVGVATVNAAIYKSSQCAFLDAEGNWVIDSNAKWVFVDSGEKPKFHCVGRIPDDAVHPERFMVTLDDGNCKMTLSPSGRTVKLGICPR